MNIMPKQIKVEGLHPKYWATHCNMAPKAPKTLNANSELSMVERGYTRECKLLMKNFSARIFIRFGDPVKIWSLRRVSGTSCNG